MLEAIMKLSEGHKELKRSGQIHGIREDFQGAIRIHAKSPEVVKMLAKANDKKIFIKKRISEDFPAELEVKIHDIAIYALLDQTELEKYQDKLQKENCPGDGGASTEGIKENISASL